MTRRVLAAALLLLAGSVAPARAQANRPTSAMDGRWHFSLAPYLWMSGIEGDVSAGPVTVPVEASFSDLWEDFDFGLAGRFEGRKDRFGFGLDFTYNNLGAPVASAAPVVGQLGLEADVRQLFGEGFGFYRVAAGGREDNPAHLDVLAGARFTGTRTRLTAQSPAGVEYDGESRELSWVDAMAGLKGRVPLGSRLALLGRADVAGLGSQLTWNLEGDLAFLAGERWTIGAGWRYMDIDYENDDSALPETFQLAYNGPRVWFAYSW
jgi:hypothetical protein